MFAAQMRSSEAHLVTQEISQTERGSTTQVTARPLTVKSDILLYHDAAPILQRDVASVTARLTRAVATARL